MFATTDCTYAPSPLPGRIGGVAVALEVAITLTESEAGVPVACGGRTICVVRRTPLLDASTRTLDVVLALLIVRTCAEEYDAPVRTVPPAPTVLPPVEEVAMALIIRRVRNIVRVIAYRRVG